MNIQSMAEVIYECADCHALSPCYRCGGVAERDAKAPHIAICVKCNISTQIRPSSDCPGKCAKLDPIRVAYCDRCATWGSSCTTCGVGLIGAPDGGIITCRTGCPPMGVDRQICHRCADARRDSSDSSGSLEHELSAMLVSGPMDRVHRRSIHSKVFALFENHRIDIIRAFIGIDSKSRAIEIPDHTAKQFTDHKFDHNVLEEILIKNRLSADEKVRVHRLYTMMQMATRRKWYASHCSTCSRQFDDDCVSIYVYICGHVCCAECNATLRAESSCPSCDSARGDVLRAKDVCHVNICRHLALIIP